MSNELRKPKPHLDFEEKYATTDPVEIPPRIHAALVQAISNKHVVTLTLRSHVELFGEPHIYGRRGGQPTLLLYNEEAVEPWQPIDVSQLVEVKAWPEHRFTKRELPAEYDPDQL